MAIVTVSEFCKDPLDFVIVGGGTAGLVLASRLSENNDIKVGVIEAGPSRLGDQSVEHPARVGTLINNAEYDWKFHSTPQVSPRDFH